MRLRTLIAGGLGAVAAGTSTLLMLALLKPGPGAHLIAAGVGLVMAAAGATLLFRGPRQQA